MEITKDDITRLANLSRIELNETEKNKFGGQIASILDYVKQIEEVDTSAVDLATPAGAQINILRKDAVNQYQETRKIIDQFPAKYGNLNKVKKVFE